MQQEMHRREGEKSSCNIIEHDSDPFRKLLQLPNWRRLEDIEGSKEYKTRQKSFPRQGDGDQRDQLSGNLVNNDQLWIFGR